MYLVFWDPLKVKYDECYKNMGICKKESVFQHFHMYFCILSRFHDTFLRRTNNLSVEIKVTS